MSSSPPGTPPASDLGDRWDWSAVTPTYAVAAELADREGLDAATMPSLFYSVDTDALDSLLRSTAEASVTITHLGYLITVTADGEVSVVDPRDGGQGSKDDTK